MKTQKAYKKKICLFFNHERGLKILQNLKKNKKYEILKVYLSKKNLKFGIKSSIKKLKYSYSIIKNVNSNKIIKFNLKNKIDLNIICGFPYIFNDKVLNSTKYGTINLHGGRLPKYKGGSPLNWQIINGEKIIGFSIIQADNSIDGGAILAQSSFKLSENLDIKHVHKIVNKKFPKLLNKVLFKIFNHTLRVKKNLKGKIYKQRKPEDGKINWKKMTNIQVHNFVRALTKPYPGAFCYEKYTNKKIIIFKSVKSTLDPKFSPGTVFIKNNSIYIKCKIRSIKIISSSKKMINNSIMY